MRYYDEETHEWRLLPYYRWALWAAAICFPIGVIAGIWLAA